jgi:DNA repair exonuclease SbcCD nuclease subunit
LFAAFQAQSKLKTFFDIQIDIMRLAIISDAHLGHGSGSERFGDSFEALSEAMDKSIGCDAILIAGDLFDSRTPSTETLTRGMEILIKPIISGEGATIRQGIGKDLEGLTPLHEQGIPVVAIHGTHERRVRGLINPVQALEKAGFLIHLHVKGVVLEKGDEKVCVQGMSGVPEQLSESVLKRWSPRPEKNCFNILMLHQSVSPFMYAEHLLPLEKIPKGFDLYVMGHIHEAKKSEHSGSDVIIPGSLVHTQLNKDSTMARGFWVFDTNSKDCAFISLDSQRRFYYMEHNGSQEGLESEIENLLEASHEKKPLIRIKGGEVDQASLKSRFGNRAIISIKRVFEEKERPKAVGVAEKRMSVSEMGRNLLRKNLESSGLDLETFEGLFELLVHGKSDEALERLRKDREQA